MNEVAIVILNYNGAHYLKDFLPSVVKHSEGCRIIVADNKSTDNSIEVLKKHFPQVEVIELAQNYGFSLGYNKALGQISADIYVLLNSDVEVSPKWWKKPVELLQSNKRITAVQPKILSYHKKDQFDYAGAGGGFIDKYGYPFCRGRLFNTIEKDLGQYDDEIKVFWASGACLFIKSEAFHAANGLDSDFFAHMEEIDLCWRLQKNGQEVWYTGKSKVYHVGGGTLEHSHPRKTYLNFRNGLSLLFKNYSTTKLLVYLPVRIFLDLIAVIKFTFTDSPKHGLAVIRAHKDFLLGLRGNIKKRKHLKKFSVAEAQNIFTGSIVFEYFIKQKRYFNELNFK